MFGASFVVADQAAVRSSQPEVNSMTQRRGSTTNLVVSSRRLMMASVMASTVCAQLTRWLA